MDDNIQADRLSFVEDHTLSCQTNSGTRQKGFTNCRGFTLIELIVVVAVLGILMAMAIPSFNGYIKTVKNKACASEIKSIEKEIAAYLTERNELPNSLSDVGAGSQRDPWDRPYVYTKLSVVGAVPLQDIAVTVLNTDYDLYSKGEDGLSDTASGNPANVDDVVRANDGSFVGMRP